MKSICKLFGLALVMSTLLILGGCNQSVEQVEPIEEVDEPDLIDTSLDPDDLIPRPIEELSHTDFVIETSPGLFLDGNKALRHKEVIDQYGVLTPQYDKDVSGLNLRIVSALLDEVFKDQIKIELSFHNLPSGRSTPRYCTDYTRWECKEYKKWKYWTESAVREWMKPFKDESTRITNNIVVGKNLSGEALNVKINYKRGTSQYKVPVLSGEQWRIWMNVGDGDFAYPTLLHEMGHAFGLYDTYNIVRENFLSEPYKDGCNPGQPSSIMCSEDVHSGWTPPKSNGYPNTYRLQMLSADDIRGVRDRFCSMYSSYCDQKDTAHRYGDKGGSADVYYCPTGGTEYVTYYDRAMRMKGNNYSARGNQTASVRKVKNLRGLRVTWGTDLDSFQAMCSFTGDSMNKYDVEGTNNRDDFFGKERRYSNIYWCKNDDAYVTEIKVDRDRSDPQSIQIVCSDGSRSPIFGKQKRLLHSYKCPSDDYNYGAAKGFTIRHDRDIDAIGLVCGRPNGSLFGG